MIMQNNIIQFEAGTPFDDEFRLLPNEDSWRWYKKVSLLSDLTGLPMQTVMENWDDLSVYLKAYQP